MKDDIYNTYSGFAYRFISSEALRQTVEHESLRFTNVTCLNDPLDSSPYLAPFDWKKYQQEDETVLSCIRESTSRKIFGSMYVCCFCKEYLSPQSYLMWSHYGKAHSELCFEIDFSRIDFLGKPSCVNYSTNLARDRDELDTKSRSDVGRFLVTSKSAIWSHEKEVRLIVDTEIKKLRDPQLSLSDDRRFLNVSFNTGIISKVIFGVKSSEKMRQQTMDLFKTKDVQPTFEFLSINPATLELKGTII